MNEEDQAPKSSTGLPSSTKPPKYFLKLAEFISKQYSSARKIVEIGVGRSPYTALQIRKFLPETELILVDVDEQVVEELRRLGFKAVRDDIQTPRLEIYENADLLYSIRPPFELIPRLIDLASLIGSDLIIAPLSEDAYLSGIGRGLKIVRLREAIAYLFKSTHR